MNAIHIYADTAWHAALTRAQVRATLQPAFWQFARIHAALHQRPALRPELSTVEGYAKLLRVLEYARLELDSNAREDALA